MRGVRAGLLITLTIVASWGVAVSASAGHGLRKATVRTERLRIFYSGFEDFDYDGHLSESPEGPPVCVRQISGTAEYFFTQHWVLTVKLTTPRRGPKSVKIVKVKHETGPEGPADDHGHATQSGSMSDCTWDFGQKPDDGPFDCATKTIRYHAYKNPQMLVEQTGDKATLILEPFSFATGSFTGDDSIPTDKSCTYFNRDGGLRDADIDPSLTATARVVFTAKDFDTLNLHNLYLRNIGWSDKDVVPTGPSSDCTLAHDHKVGGCTLDRDKSELDANIEIFEDEPDQ